MSRPTLNPDFFSADVQALNPELEEGQKMHERGVREKQAQITEQYGLPNVKGRVELEREVQAKVVDWCRLYDVPLIVNFAGAFMKAGFWRFKKFIDAETERGAGGGVAARTAIQLQFQISRDIHAALRRMTAAGLEEGWPDFEIPLMRQGHGALYIELKREKGGVISDAQKDKAALLIANGYRHEFIKGYEATIAVIANYCGIEL